LEDEMKDRDIERALEKGSRDGETFKRGNRTVAGPIGELFNPSYNPPSDKELKPYYDFEFKKHSGRK